MFGGSGRTKCAPINKEPRRSTSRGLLFENMGLDRATCLPEQAVSWKRSVAGALRGSELRMSIKESSAKAFEQIGS